MSWLYVFLGGGLGSLCRYALAVGLPTADLTKGMFPWATLLANVAACLVLSFGLVTVGRESALPKHYALLILTGFCGGFSTFSTFTAEALTLYESGYWGLAALYLLGSLLAGVAAIVLGLYLLR